MDDLGLIIFALIVGFLFWGPHNKTKKKDDKKGEDEKKGK